METVPVEFKVLIDGKWKIEYMLLVDPAELLAVQQLVARYRRNGMGIFSSKDQVLRPQTCFQQVIDDGSKTIHLRPEWKVMKRREAAGRK